MKATSATVHPITTPPATEPDERVAATAAPTTETKAKKERQTDVFTKASQLARAVKKIDADIVNEKRRHAERMVELNSKRTDRLAGEADDVVAKAQLLLGQE